jgi:hypothetical protein
MVQYLKRILAEDGSRVSSGLFVFGLHLVRHFFLKGGVEGTGVLSRRSVKTGMSYTQTADAMKDMTFYARYKPIVREAVNALLPSKVRKQLAEESAEEQADGEEAWRQPAREAWRQTAREFLSQDDVQDFIKEVHKFYDGQDVATRELAASCGVVPHCGSLVTEATDEILKVMESNFAYPFHTRVKQLCKTFSRDTAVVATAVYLTLGVGQPRTGGTPLDLGLLRAMKDVASWMSWDTKKFLEARIAVTEAVLAWQGGDTNWRSWEGWRSHGPWRGVKVDRGTVKEGCEQAALAALVEKGMGWLVGSDLEFVAPSPDDSDDEDFYGGEIRGDDDDEEEDVVVEAAEVAEAAEGLVALAGAAGAAEATVDSPALAPGGGVAAANPPPLPGPVCDAVDQAAESFPLKDLNVGPLNGETIKKERIFAAIDASIKILEMLEEHYKNVESRKEFRDTAYEKYKTANIGTNATRLKLRSAKRMSSATPMSKAEYLESEEFAKYSRENGNGVSMTFDVVKDTQVRLFSIVPHATMSMRHSTVTREGLFSVLSHLDILPDKVKEKKGRDQRRKAFTPEVAAKALGRILTPEREKKTGAKNKGQHFGSKGLGRTAHVRINPKTVSFTLRPEKAVKKKKGGKSTKGGGGMSYAMWKRIERSTMATTMAPEDFWEGDILLPSDHSMAREVFLRDETEKKMWEALRYDVWAVDPGEKYPFYAVRLRDGKTLSLSREAFYVKSKMDERERKVAAWMKNSKGVQEFLEELKQSTGPKTASYREHGTLLKTIAKHMGTIRDTLWHELGRKRARQDFNVHINRQRTVSKEISKFSEGSEKPVAVIWGTANIRYVLDRRHHRRRRRRRRRRRHRCRRRRGPSVAHTSALVRSLAGGDAAAVPPFPTFSARRLPGNMNFCGVPSSGRRRNALGVVVD